MILMQIDRNNAVGNAETKQQQATQRLRQNDTPKQALAESGPRAPQRQSPWLDGRFLSFALRRLRREFGGW
jgi:hypothetical protein